MGGKGLGHCVKHQRLHRSLGQVVVRPLKLQQPFIAHTERFMNQRSEHDGKEMAVLEASHRLQSKDFPCEVLEGTGRISLQGCRREAPFHCRRLLSADHAVERTKFGGFSLDGFQGSEALLEEGPIVSHCIEYW